MTNTKHNLIHSTYYGDDCIFLLEDLTNKITPLSVEEKEAYTDPEEIMQKLFRKKIPLMIISLKSLKN